MFAKTIVDSDAFLDMPLSTQALYFHLSMQADDDGFITNPKKTQKIVGATDEDLSLLITNQFLISFESGVAVIRHWRVHNYIPKDRYKPTEHQQEMQMLSEDKNHAYAVCIQNVYKMYTDCIQNVDKMYTECIQECIQDVDKPYTKCIQNGSEQQNPNLDVPIDSVYNKNINIKSTNNRVSTLPITDTKSLLSAEEEKEEEEKEEASAAASDDIKNVVDSYNEICTSFSKCESLSEASRKDTAKAVAQYGIDKIRTAFQKVQASRFLRGKWWAKFDWVIKPDNLAKILNGNFDEIKGTSTSTNGIQRDYCEFIGEHDLDDLF